MALTNPPPLHSVLDLLLDAICVVDAQGRFVYLSAACEGVFGYKPEELVGRVMMDLVAPEDRERTQLAAEEVMAGEAKHHFENRYVRKDGRRVDIMWSARWSEADQVRIGVARDITKRKRAESLQAAMYAISEAAHNSAIDLPALFAEVHRMVRGLLPAVSFLVALYDPHSRELSFPYHAGEHGDEADLLAAAHVLCHEVVQTGNALLLAPGQASACHANVRSQVDTEAFCWLATPLSAGEGSIGAVLLRSPLAFARYDDKDQELLQFVSSQVATAIERKRLYARLQQMACYDELTGLPNRGVLLDRMKTALMRARRDAEPFAVLYLDLNGFKQVNDRYGHLAGDLLLQEFSRRLEGCVREVDTVARIGGDEFIVLLERCSAREDAVTVVEKIRSAMASPVTIIGIQLRIEPSIGVAHYPADGENEAQLIRHADAAMFANKQQFARNAAGSAE
jgi:diguanylate cyclase (GGDEF)-like protein/PAS domain S-box-containing protein